MLIRWNVGGVSELEVVDPCQLGFIQDGTAKERV